MTPVQSLYYALGEVAYAVAKADGTIQPQERERLHDILTSEFKSHKEDVNCAEIIFHLLKREQISSSTAYERGMHEIRLNSHYMSETLKQKFISVIRKVAEAFPPVVGQEQAVINDFTKELNAIHGDPVFSRETER